MIPANLRALPFVCLVFALLVACEPLAPEQNPQYIVVTGETPATTPDPFLALAGSTPPPADQGIANLSAVASASGTVNTPEPTATPMPTATVLPTATSFVCGQSAGQLLELSLSSDIAGGELPFLLYLPPCFYETLQRYPYVILLHGTGYDHTMWRDLGAVDVMDQGIANGLLPPMVLVMPDGGYPSEMNDQLEGQSYESILLDELLPLLEGDFCLWGSRSGRAIGGISRGGFWAFSIALRHPELFSAVGGHSPFFAPDNALPENNPLNLAEGVSLSKFPLRIYIDNGANDYVGQNAMRMSEILRQRGIEHDYLINPVGDHDMAYWRSHVAEYLTFYGESWPRDVPALPSCLEPSP